MLEKDYSVLKKLFKRSQIIDEYTGEKTTLKKT